MSDSVNRFSTRVENYAKFRPGYPVQMIDLLQRECGLTSQSRVADIGSGTGKLSEIFLNNGNLVFAVEPNDGMRSAAEHLLQKYRGFVSVGATAERTTLESGSVDFVTAGQAFHWFDQEKARAEFSRILKPGGWVVLVWNERRLDATPFLRAYEELLRRYGTDYQQVRHENTTKVIHNFFAPEILQLAGFENLQEFDFEGLLGRVKSSSYTPEPGHPNFERMIASLREVFAQHSQAGKIAFEYYTSVYFGHLPPRC